MHTYNTTRLHYPQVNSFHYPLDRRLGGPRGLERLENTQISYPYRESSPPSAVVHSIAYSLQPTDYFLGHLEETEGSAWLHTMKKLVSRISKSEFKADSVSGETKSTQLANNFQACYATHVSWAKWIYSTSTQPASLRFILTQSSQLPRRLLNILFRLSIQRYARISHLFRACYMARLTHSSWFDHDNKFGSTFLSNFLNHLRLSQCGFINFV